jgi:hypothetical protein
MPLTRFCLEIGGVSLFFLFSLVANTFDLWRAKLPPKPTAVS